jgi:hypothetical protein
MCTLSYVIQVHEYFQDNQSHDWMSMCNLVEQKGDSADSISYLTTADHDYTTYDHENKRKPPAVGAKYVSSALWEPEHLICMDKTGSMAKKAPGYHK